MGRLKKYNGSLWRGMTVNPAARDKKSLGHAVLVNPPVRIVNSQI